MPQPPHISLLLPLILLFLLFAAFVHLLTVRFRPGLRSIPGPFLASITDLDRLWSSLFGLQMKHHFRLHEKYGKLVRVGPNHVSFTDPEEISKVYGFGSKFVKSDFYRSFDVPLVAGHVMPSMFSVSQEDVHKSMRKPVANIYSMSVMKEFEPMNDECSDIFMAKLDGMVERAGGEDTFDLGTFVHWYAFDVITSITFSNRLDFVQQEKDVHNIIAAISGRLTYSSVIGQAPYLHKFFFGNAWFSKFATYVPALAQLNANNHIASFTRDSMEKYNDQEFNTGTEHGLSDMVEKFRNVRDGGKPLTDLQLLMHANGNVGAGADTTAGALRAIFYYLCRTPTAYAKVLAELDAADTTGQISDPVTFAEAQKLPYFQATVKEALRLNPGVGMLLERVVPRGGAELSGVWIPEGTIVGINPWVAARDTSVYGDDALEFRPERWLEADEAQLRRMERSFLAFGAGSRVCLGRNVSLLEISKFVPQVLRRFEFELADPEKEWQLHGYFLIKQTGLVCKVRRRVRQG